MTQIGNAATYGRGNPHCQTVSGHLAAGQSYDVALGRWITRRAAA